MNRAEKALKVEQACYDTLAIRKREKQERAASTKRENQDAACIASKYGVDPMHVKKILDGQR